MSFQNVLDHETLNLERDLQAHHTVQCTKETAKYKSKHC